MLFENKKAVSHVNSQNPYAQMILHKGSDEESTHQEQEGSHDHETCVSHIIPLAEAKEAKNIKKPRPWASVVVLHSIPALKLLHQSPLGRAIPNPNSHDDPSCEKLDWESPLQLPFRQDLSLPGCAQDVSGGKYFAFIFRIEIPCEFHHVFLLCE